MTAEELFRAIGTADEEFLEHSERRVKRRSPWRRLAAAAACLCLIAAGSWALHGEHIREAIARFRLGQMELGCPVEFPGGIDPVLRVNGRLYRWIGLNGLGGFTVDEDGVLRGQTCLPEGFQKAGEISSVTEEEPVEDFQIQAGTPISGTVYVDPEAPLVVYACVRTGWLEDCYVRFVHEDYRTGLVRVEGKLYRWYDDDWGYYGRLEELPPEAVYVGEIWKVVEDRYPVRDLEASNDDWNLHMTGRQVYQDPADDSVVYINDEQHWSGGINYYWRLCPLLEQN